MDYEDLQKDLDRLRKENLDLTWKINCFKSYGFTDHLKLAFKKLWRNLK